MAHPYNEFLEHVILDLEKIPTTTVASITSISFIRAQYPKPNDTNLINTVLTVFSETVYIKFTV